MGVPDAIDCIDCGGRAVRIGYDDPDHGPEPGDIVTYRCRDCWDRWDLEVGPDQVDD